MTSTKPGRLTGDIDLLSYYNLIPIYNKVVKPYPPSNRSEGIEPTLLPYINYLPGKLDMEPDGYLINILRDPQVNETGPDIKPLDMDTLKDAFTLKEGPVPGFDVSILGTDDGNTLAQYNGVEKDNNGDYDKYGERRHKKKKKKRKHEHEHDEEGHVHSDHKKKKKRKKEREYRRDDNEGESLIID